MCFLLIVSPTNLQEIRRREMVCVSIKEFFSFPAVFFTFEVNFSSLKMSGIYIHIPFCKQACFYCDFHFSTSLKKKDEMIGALRKEIALRKNELQNETIQTIYFGGGTPSLLSVVEIEKLIQQVNDLTNFI